MESHTLFAATSTRLSSKRKSSIRRMSTVAETSVDFLQPTVLLSLLHRIGDIDHARSSESLKEHK